MVALPFQHTVADRTKKMVLSDASVRKTFLRNIHVDELLDEDILIYYRPMFNPVPNFDLTRADIPDPDVWVSMREMAQSLIDKNLFILPFPKCWLVLDEYAAVYAQQNADTKELEFIVYSTSRVGDQSRISDDWSFAIPTGDVSPHDRQSMRVAQLVKNDYMVVKGETLSGKPIDNSAAGAQTILGAVSDVMARLMMIMSPGTEVFEQPEPTKLNKARVARGNEKISARYTVRLLDLKTKRERAGEGTHASPVVHWRRAHYRNLPGKPNPIPVVACIVGAQNEEVPELGKRMYEYIKKAAV